MFRNTIPFTDDQSRLIVDAEHHYAQWLEAKRNSVETRGWMRWKTTRGKEYLIHGQSGGANQKSLGPRSAETEARYAQFQNDKTTHKNQLREIENRLAERAPLLKAARSGRMVSGVAKVIREYAINNLIGDFLIVTGTHAIHAYETLAARWFDSALAGTEDLDLLWHPRNDDVEFMVRRPNVQLLTHLKAIDDTYTVNAENRFQVRNSRGMVVDFLTGNNVTYPSAKGFLSPIPLEGQDWLVICPPVKSIVIDTQGYPVELACPDPRIFCLHKLWVSKRNDRNPLKKRKDEKQAIALSLLLKQYLPQFPFSDEFLSALPEELSLQYENTIQPLLSEISTDNFSGGM